MSGDMGAADQPWNHRLYLPAYRYSEVARFARTSAATVRRWYRGYEVPGHHMEPVLPTGHENLLSYIQLVETVFVVNFRRAGVKLDALRHAHDYLRATFAYEYPFAQLKLRTDGKNVLAETLPASESLLIIANKNGQLVWREAVCEQFEQFDYDDGLALRWHLRGRDNVVLIDPRIAFGTPVIENTGVPTYVIKERFAAGENIDDIRDDYGISLRQIEQALDFEGVRTTAA